MTSRVINRHLMTLKKRNPIRSKLVFKESWDYRDPDLCHVCAYVMRNTPNMLRDIHLQISITDVFMDLFCRSSQHLLIRTESVLLRANIKWEKNMQTHPRLARAGVQWRNESNNSSFIRNSSLGLIGIGLLLSLFQRQRIRWWSDGRIESQPVQESP